MKKIAWLILILLQSLLSAAQQTNSTSPVSAKPPLEFRQVSGIVRDSTGAAVEDATIKLVSAKDSATTITDKEGIFIFDNVRMATFVLTVSGLGFSSIIRKYLNNDLARNIVLDPIVLNERSYQLEKVNITGSPRIVYKPDTIEYRASDYKVRDGATIDELLKQMEGMDVRNNGDVSHNGAPVNKARLNGKDINNGNVAATIKSLPAEIVDKIQVIDDYGDMAARTGIKSGDPSKTLNITTRTDKSVGNMAKLNGGLGTNTQTEGSANLTRINRNKTITGNGSFFKTPGGIASGGLSDAGTTASGGTNTTLRPYFTYRNNWGSKLSLLANYAFSYTDNTTLTDIRSQWFSTLGMTYASQNADNHSSSRAHRLNLEFEYTIDSANFIQFRPAVSINSSWADNTSMLFQNGLVHQDQLNRSSVIMAQPGFNGAVAYQHVWRKKPARIFAAELTIGAQKNDHDSDQNNDIKYYQGSSQTVLKDSVVNRTITTDNLQNNYRTSITYAEPLSRLARLEFSSILERRAYDNTRLTGKLNSTGLPSLIDSLSNIYEYSFSQYRNSLNYRYGNNSGKYDFSLGLTVVATSLKGTKASLGTRTDQNYLKLIPIARFRLKLSAMEQITFNYYGRVIEPDFNQMQPIRDISNPQNAVVGNPNLKSSFIHTINGQYGNYIPNSRLNYLLRLSWAFTENQVSSNIVQVQDAYGSLKNETHYININGNNSRSADYTISKTLNNRAYRLEFSGNVVHTNRISMSNHVRNKATTWGFRESFGPRINPKSWLEINPHLSYDFSRTDYSLQQSADIVQGLWALSMEGKIFFLKKMQFGYTISKNYISGIGTNITRNPLVINTMLEARLNARVSLQLGAFDLLDQNNFLRRNITENRITETLTNPDSRYFILNLRINFQKWTAAKERNGQPIIRKGDGSFIN